MEAAKKAEQKMISQSIDNVRATLLAERVRAQHAIRQSRAEQAARNGTLFRSAKQREAQASLEIQMERRGERARGLAMRRQGEASHAEAARNSTLALHEAKAKQAEARREMRKAGAQIIGATQHARADYFKMLRGNLNIQPLHRASA